VLITAALRWLLLRLHAPPLRQLGLDALPAPKRGLTTTMFRGMRYIAPFR
jgi:hypothetical protein